MKKLIVWMLVFSLLGISSNLLAKERRGAEVVIVKKDGQKVRGELIAVKKKSLLLASDLGTDVSVDNTEISAVTIVKRSKVLKGMGLGLLIGGGVGAVLGFAGGGSQSFLIRYTGENGSSQTLLIRSKMEAEDAAIFGGMFFGLIGVITGAIGGAAAGADKTIKISVTEEKAVSSILGSLRPQARYPDFQ